jgi:hemolysin activation/secretion protein
VDRIDFIPTSRNKGSDWQASIRYGAFIVPNGNFFQKAKAGFDLKQTNNDLTVANINYIANSFATVFQAVGAYEASYTYKKNSFDFVGEGYVQPWDFGKTMSETNYAQLRPNAVNKYLYVRLKGDYAWQDPSGMMFTVKARAQFSSGALIPLETLGLGGINSIRGYVERVVNVDNGGIFNFEFRTPFVSPSGKRINDSLSGVLFADLGAGGVLKSLPGQPSSYFLAGIGPGIRYDISTVLRTRFDVGFRLTDNPFASSSSSVAQYYFGVIASY